MGDSGVNVRPASVAVCACGKTDRHRATSGCAVVWLPAPAVLLHDQFGSDEHDPWSQVVNIVQAHPAWDEELADGPADVVAFVRSAVQAFAPSEIPE